MAEFLFRMVLTAIQWLKSSMLVLVDLALLVLAVGTGVILAYFWLQGALSNNIASWVVSMTTPTVVVALASIPLVVMLGLLSGVTNWMENQLSDAW